MNTLEAILIAVLQGATELFPVSSLGHAVVLPALFDPSIDLRSPAFLPFLVMLHTGTATALLLYFWRDWWTLFRGVIGLSRGEARREARFVFARIIVATIPAVILGFLLEKFFRGLFGTPVVAAAFLIVNGAMLFLGERLRGHAPGRGHRPLSSLTFTDAAIIGLWQCTALIPGISRSGATIVGGLLRGIDHEGSAHFSFLIATPIIIGATVLEVPKLLHADMPQGVFGTALIAAVVAGVTAFASTAFLMRYFRRGDLAENAGHDAWSLNPFAIYCVIFGAGSLAYLLLA